MSAIQPRSFDGSDEKLRSISVFACVSHGKDKLFVFELEILIVESVAIDAEINNEYFHLFLH